ncbi:MAG: EAL domain-containing protein [Burkholderiaceae bacterium]
MADTAATTDRVDAGPPGGSSTRPAIPQDTGPDTGLPGTLADADALADALASDLDEARTATHPPAATASDRRASGRPGAPAAAIAVPVAIALAAIALWATDPPSGAWIALVWLLAAGIGWQAWRARRDRDALRVARDRLARSRTFVRRRERQFRAAQKLGALGMWEQDLATQRFEWSNGAFRLFGIQPAQGAPSLQGFLICVHPDDQRRWRDVHRRAATSGGEVRVEYRYVRKGVDTIWVRSIARAERDADGRVTRLTGIVQDVSGIRDMQQQLAASEAKFRELTRMSSDWIWETDRQHRLSYISDSVDAVLGTWARSAIGKHHRDGAVDLMKSDWDAHQRALDHRKPLEDFEFCMLDPEGHVFYIAVSGRPLFDANGEFIGYRGIGRNITHERHQRTLLELESDVAEIMREQNTPERVIDALLERVCDTMNWSGGVYLTRSGSTISMQRRWGSPALTRMLDELPAQMQVLPDSAEAQAWESGRSSWLANLDQHPAMVERYRTRPIGARAMFLAPIRDESGVVMSMLMFFSPLSHRDERFLAQVAESLSNTLSLYLQRHAAERRLTHASLHDALTGLPNRMFLTHQLGERLSAGRPLALLYVDLDRYKIINDTLGHSVGDQVLIEVARRFRDAIGPADIAGRIGGDEFILLLNEIADRDQVEIVARRILESIEKPFILNGRPHFLSASIGVALAPQDSSDPKLLIKCADAAMYEVKSAGRNDVRFFDGGQSAVRDEQLQLATELPLALQRGEVDLYYQPIFAVGARTVVGLEALIRWHHPTRGLLLPDKFLPQAEQSNLIREIGHWTLRRALDDRRQLGIDRYPDVTISVNVSARQLAEDSFSPMLEELLAQRAIPPGLLRLELTESAFIESPERTVAVIERLRRGGVRVIIDNFGTGYASLAYLKNLPVDGLKIDRVFVKDLATDRGNAAIVQAVTTLAAKLGLQAMAEGVESAAEVHALRDYECDQMQGSLIAEPLAFAQLCDFMETLPRLRRLHQIPERAP